MTEPHQHPSVKPGRIKRAERERKPDALMAWDALKLYREHKTLAEIAAALHRSEDEARAAIQEALRLRMKPESGS